MKRFKKFYIEIINSCNLSCDFCPTHNRKPKYMTEEEFSYILDQIKPYTDYIYLHVKGEPLMHPKLNQLLKISGDKGFQVNITTNGTLLLKTKEILILNSCVRQINISLHSIAGNSQYGRKDEYIDNILSFTSEALSRSNIIISYRFWNLVNDATVNLSQNKNKEYLEKIEAWFNLPHKIQDTITEGNGIKLGERLYLNQDPVFEWPDINQEAKDVRGFCYGLRNQIGVLADGTVIPCCLDGDGVINLGNIFYDNFSDILESDRARSIYEGFSNKIAVEELCKRCGYRTRFSNK